MSVFQSVQDAVRHILGAPPMAEEVGLPTDLREINNVRSAAARVLEEVDLSDGERAELLLLVMKTAALATLPDWAMAAVWSEIDWAFDREPKPIVSVYAHAARSLRRLGYRKCPICRLDVLDEVELHRMEDSEKQWLADEVRQAFKLRKRES